MSSRILEVTEVELLILESQPPQLTINALGTVSTSGWSNPKLNALDTDPKDGIYEYEFVADPPTGIALQVLMPIAASLRLSSIPEDLKGVRIFSANNEVVQTLATNRSTIRPDMNQPGLPPAMEKLFGFSVEEDALKIKVFTGGCTSKEHFYAEVRTGFTGLPPYLVTFFRTVPDHCDDHFPEGVEFEFSFSELGILGGSEIILLNPLVKRSDKTSIPEASIPLNPFPSGPIPIPQPWPWPINPSPIPWPWPGPIPGPWPPHPWSPFPMNPGPTPRPFGPFRNTGNQFLI